MAFLVQSAAEGTTWRFSLLHRFWATSPLYLHLYRIFFLIVVGILSTWISERWVLRDADARSAGSVSIRDGRVSYMFVDGSGEYHGGEGFPFRLVSAPELAALVLYNVRRPELNKIALGCLFHRFVIIGRGITDLDEATAAVPSKPVVSTT